MHITIVDPGKGMLEIEEILVTVSVCNKENTIRNAHTTGLYKKYGCVGTPNPGMLSMITIVSLNYILLPTLNNMALNAMQPL